MFVVTVVDGCSDGCRRRRRRRHGESGNGGCVVVAGGMRLSQDILSHTKLLHADYSILHDNPIPMR